MYDIDKHIHALKSKGEDWPVTQIELIRAEIDTGYGFQICNNTLERLNDKIKILRLKRDEYEPFSLDYQREWSILKIIENVRDLIKASLEEKNEKLV